MAERSPVTTDSHLANAHLNRLLLQTDIEEPWYKSIGRGVRELLNPPKLPPLELTSRPVMDADLGDIQRVEIPWYKSLVSNIRDLINPPKLAPLEVSSRPVEVGSIWGAYRGGESRSGMVSVLVHVAVIGLLLLIFRPVVFQERKKVDLGSVVFVPAFKPKLPPAATRAGGGGGGGQKMPTPVSKGAPPPPAPKSFIPPDLAKVQPKLPVTPTITAPVPQIQADQYGDPKALNDLLSGGQGANGLGNGKGGGLGNGNGDGYGDGSGGGQGGGAFRVGGDVSAPVILTRTEPEYSDEARKAKFSGNVLLQFVVGTNGLPSQIKVLRPLGLGLDEKAIEALSHWKFRPGMRGGRAVPVQATIEVSFRLL